MTPLKRNSGFTLIEVIIAMTILAVGILAVVQLFSNALRQARWAAENTTVSQVVQGVMGEVKSGGVENLVTKWAAENAAKAAESNYVMYEGYRTSVQRVADVVGLYRVTCTVVLPGGREDNFVTYVTEL